MAKFIKKFIVMSTILFAQGLFLYGFYYNEDLIFNFKASYLTKIYLPSYVYSFNNIKSNTINNLANISAAFNGNNSDKTASADYQQNKLLAKSVPVLLYHGVIENPDGANILLEDFKNQMFALKKAGWQTVTLEDFYKFMRGEKELPDKSFLLTFDDGRKDSYYPVDPILKALDYNAVMFVISGRSLGKETEISSFHLSEKELKKMIKSGRWEIESHGKNDHDFYKISADGNEGHFLSNKLWLNDEQRIETEEEFKKRIYSDLVLSKNELESTFNIKVNSFAYPFGDYGQNSMNFPEAKAVVSEVASSIYSTSFYQVWPGKGFSFNYSKNDEFLIKRIDVKPDWSPEILISILDTGKEKSLSYFNNFEKDGDWVSNWGSATWEKNSIILGANASTTGGAEFLDGSHSWRDYIFNSRIDWFKGSNVSLLARYKDNENYAACNFSDDDARIEQRLNGRNRIMVEVKYDSEFSKNDLKLGVRVKNDKIECLIGDKVVAYAYYLSPVLSNGGIGFKTWDPEINNSEIIVKEVSVEEIK